MNALWLYKKALILGTPALNLLLASRLRKGKEDPARIGERKGIASLPKPFGPLLWVHVASVGEAQSVLSMIALLLGQNSQLNILVTSVTKTSATLLAQKLPPRAFHQYAPVDHPDWVRRFLDHWKPDIALWVESELWPTMLTFLKKRRIPSALLNAHMSQSSFRNWKRAPALAGQLLSGFLVVLAQSPEDAGYFSHFRANNVVVTDNIKYAAAPLRYNEEDLAALKAAIGNRPVWLYASTHDGEEDIAAETHKALEQAHPGILTIIAPRHPERRAAIIKTMRDHGLNASLRGAQKTLPSPADQVYITDTMGELGLFYKAAPLAVIGRSFSKDGGGGHNPIEPALLHCAVFSGPAVHNLARIYDEMKDQGAAIVIERPEDVAGTLSRYMGDAQALSALQDKGRAFAKTKSDVLKTVIEELEPVFLEAHLPPPKVTA